LSLRRKFFLVATLVLVAFLAAPQTMVVRGDSMLPQLAEGQKIWMKPIWQETPQRGDLAVFEEPDSGQVAVKRVGGLPGERIRIAGGDLFIDGERHSRSVSGIHQMVPLLRVSAAEIQAAFGFSHGAVSSDSVHLGSEGGWQALNETPTDGFVLEGELVRGERPASDLGVQVAVRTNGEGRFRASIREGQALFGIELNLSSGQGEYGWNVLQSDGSMVLQEPEAKFSFSPKETMAMVFLAKIDHRLILWVDGEEVFPPKALPLIAPTPMADVPLGRAFEQVLLGGDGIDFLDVVVARDLFYQADGNHASSTEFQLAEDEYFLLGDHQRVSRDSRHYGGVKKSLFLGWAGDGWPAPSTLWSASGK